jgi:4'-phosphopantetheinyl transferase
VDDPSVAHAVVIRWQHTTGAGPADLDAAVALLSRAERGQLERLLRLDDRRDYALAHALLRQSLASTGNHAAADWQFTKDERGRPGLANGQLVFSLSHTRGLVACAVSTVGQVGIDVEAVRPIEAAQIADDFFSPEERRQFESLGTQAAALRFFDYWTLKEAYAKAIGAGLDLPLNATSFTVAGGTIDASFRTGSPAAACALFAAGEQYRLAVAAIAQTGDARLLVKNRNASAADGLRVIAVTRGVLLEGFGI